MFFKKENKQNRKGMNLYAIIGGIALAAILGLVVAPRLASAELPGFRSNLRSDMNSMEEMLNQYAANHQGSYVDLAAGNIFTTLAAEGILEGSMAANSNANAYFPSWSGLGVALDGDLSLTLKYVSPTRINVLVSINIGAAGNQELDAPATIVALERTVFEFARDKYGNVDGTIAAAAVAADIGLAAPFVTEGAAGVGAGSLGDGLIEYTIR